MDELGKGPRAGQVLFLKENPATYLASDAENILESSKKAKISGNIDNEAALARSAIIIYFAALEGFINFVYEYSDVPRSRWKNLSIKEKIFRVIDECLPMHGKVYEKDGSVLYKPGDKIESIAQNTELFNRFLEVKAVRNDMVHIQPIIIELVKEDLESYRSRYEKYPLTGLPKRLMHFRSEHAQTAVNICKDMIDELVQCMRGAVGNPAHISEAIEYFIDDDLGNKGK